MHDLAHFILLLDPSVDIDFWASGKLPAFAPERKRFTTSTPIAMVDVGRGLFQLTIHVPKRGSGCDLWTFDEDGKIVRKDSFWKIREPT
jgi:hypothetical protein